MVISQSPGAVGRRLRLPAICSDRQRHQQQRRGEDRRDHAGGVDLDRQVRCAPAASAARGLALGILDQHAALGPLHEADEQDQRDARAGRRRRSSAGSSCRCGRLRAAARSPCGSRATMPAMMISDTPLPMPRLVICSPIHIRNKVPPTRLIVAATRNSMPGSTTAADAWLAPQAFEADRDEIALHRGQRDGQVAGVLVELLAPGLAFLLQLLPRPVERGAELHDDRRGDVRHHAERDRAHPLERAAREGVEEVEDAAALGLEQCRHRERVDARHAARTTASGTGPARRA